MLDDTLSLIDTEAARKWQRLPDDIGDLDAPRIAAVILVNGNDISPEPIAWLWPDWLALGKLHVLAGAPGQGKTTIALAIAAAVTTGTTWPDGTRCELLAPDPLPGT